VASDHQKLQKKQVLFVTDNILEAEAAKKFGITAVIADRPGNKLLPSTHPFQVVSSFDELFHL
jgi:methionine salvage enolase-phosphatase E1